MDRDIAAYLGDNRKPVVILVPGLGMDKTIWENPTQARLFGGSLPVGIRVTYQDGSQSYIVCTRAL